MSALSSACSEREADSNKWNHEAQQHSREELSGTAPSPCQGLVTRIFQQEQAAGGAAWTEPGWHWQGRAEDREQQLSDCSDGWEAATAQTDLTWLAVTWALPPLRGGGRHSPQGRQENRERTQRRRSCSPTWPRFTDNETQKKSVPSKSLVALTGLLLQCDFQSFPEKKQDTLFSV